MMIGDASKAAIANMPLNQQILFCQVILRSISGGSFLITPIVGQLEAMKAVNDIANSRLQFLRRNMAMVDMGDLVGIQKSPEMAGHLTSTQICPIIDDPN